MDRKVVVATCSAEMPIRLDVVGEVLGDDVELRAFDLPFHFGEAELPSLVAALRDASAVLVRTGNLTAALLEQLPRLRCASAHGTGTDQIDVAAAGRNHTWVTNVPNGNIQDVAEFTLGLILNLLRHIPEATTTLRRERTWDGARRVGTRLAALTVGVLGYGYTGKRVAAMCRAVGATVLASSRSHTSGEVDGIQMVPFEQVLARADVLSIHIPLNAATRGLLNAEALAAMKPGALIVNTARGGIIDQHALEDALRRGHLGGAALDVLDPEPPAFTEALLQMPNVWVTPHMAGSTSQCLHDIARTAAEDIRRVLDGQRPKYAIRELL
ncbi:2-hydroxyacid dehydrogenase [Acanthopleuribacter pedis]|uniref:D-3-phosphoglycerate dehydrogenase n=1 Tax=Acanthopleuribacter pedis TaxID=442870 RepID=A0A8J7QEC1_9BACT|nr:NAD(P)-dependent oxidoreductase [Acanthopleuribacter pedis]MBO1322324.1 hypothetical protein [Acanthopleuribacter pedis]